MAWTAPRTWVTGEVVTAAIMNTHVRDNLNALNGFVAKTADESVSSSAVLQNDDHLFYTIGATGTYIIDCYLIGTSAANAAGDLSVGFSFPTGTLHMSMTGPDAAMASGTIQTGNWFTQLSATSGTSSLPFGLSTIPVIVQVHAILTATATGTLRVMWAQFASNANASTLKAGSHMRVVQVA